MRNRDAIRLTRTQVREVDRLAVEEYGIPSIVLMENAARNTAAVVLGMYPPPVTVAVVCGGGNNGGDGFAIARHLHNGGARVDLFTACRPDRLTGDAAINHRIARCMGLRCHPFDTAEAMPAARPVLEQAAVIVDALLGTGFSGEVRPPLDLAIKEINAAREQGAVVVAVDVPSGLDCDTGRAAETTVRADVTVTFVARKTGFDVVGASAWTGRIIVADIGAPVELAERVLTRPEPA